MAEGTVGELVPIFIMGKRYEVPASLTIQKAMEYAGYQLVRGCGCRGGICGACGTVYRFPGSHKIEIGLACQTVVEPNMYLTQIPFFPANRTVYDIQDSEANIAMIEKLYPELFRCVSCNTCTKSCPMDIEVMDYVNAAIRGDIEKAAEISFDCVMCGLCTSRCPAEIVQYNVGILCRRLYAKHIANKDKHLKEETEKIERGDFEECLEKLVKADRETLKNLYNEREMEPPMAPEDWTPEDSTYL